MELGITILLDRTRFSILQLVLQVFGVILAYLTILYIGFIYGFELCIHFIGIKEFIYQ